MSKLMTLYLTLIAIGLYGKTIAAGKEVQLTDDQAAPLLASGSIQLVGEAAPIESPELMTLPDGEFDAALAGMKLDELKTVVASHGMAEGNAKSKADFIAVIKAARDAAGQ